MSPHPSPPDGTPALAWRTFWIASAAVFLVLLDTTAVVAAYSPLREHFSAVSVADLSWTLNAYTVLYAALLVPAGRLAGRIGHRPLLVVGGVLYAVTQAWLSLSIGKAPDYLSIWLPAQLLTGTAIGLGLPALSGAAVANLGPTRFGVGGGENNAMRQFGGAAGAALAVALVGHAGASLQQFQYLYALLGGLGLLTALLSLPVQTRMTAVAAPKPTPSGTT